VILSYGPSGTYRHLVERLTPDGVDASTRIVVVHNPSVDGEQISSESPAVEIINNTSNVGYSGGMNVGLDALRACAPRHILLLTHEVSIDWPTICRLRDALDGNSGYAAVGPILYLPDGSMHSAGLAARQRMVDWDHRRYLPSGYMDLWASDALDGSVMLWRSDVVHDLSGFDERFFMYCEDVDLCCRARARGYTVGVVPEASAVSQPGGSQSRPAAHGYLRTRNGLECYRKQGRTQLATGLLAVSLNYLSHVPKPWRARFRSPAGRARARAYRRGIRHGVCAFTRRRWGPPQQTLLARTDIGGTTAVHPSNPPAGGRPQSPWQP
jgi:N-acetylglucosaminyl-diphospho-decaprenol L-rhamnosyltransferase